VTDLPGDMVPEDPAHVAQSARSVGASAASAGPAILGGLDELVDDVADPR
jgi:hypothetical protein